MCVNKYWFLSKARPVAEALASVEISCFFFLFSPIYSVGLVASSHTKDNEVCFRKFDHNRLVNYNTLFALQLLLTTFNCFAVRFDLFSKTISRTPSNPTSYRVDKENTKEAKRERTKPTRQ